MIPKIIIIATGLVFAFVGYKKSWYPSWALLFNLLISIYIGVMTAPQLVDKWQYFRNYLGNYSYSIAIFTVAGGLFIILQLFSFRFFTAVFVVSLPRIMNSFGAAILGFITGAIAADFLLFLIAITPLSDHSVVKFFVQGKSVHYRDNDITIASCSFVHSISLQPCPTGIDKQMEKILIGWRKPEEIKVQAPISVEQSKPRRTEVEE
jgi:hypothetical protein